MSEGYLGLRFPARLNVAFRLWFILGFSSETSFSQVPWFISWFFSTNPAFKYALTRLGCASGMECGDFLSDCIFPVGQVVYFLKDCLPKNSDAEILLYFHYVFNVDRGGGWISR